MKHKTEFVYLIVVINHHAFIYTLGPGVDFLPLIRELKPEQCIACQNPYDASLLAYSLNAELKGADYL